MGCNSTDPATVASIVVEYVFEAVRPLSSANVANPSSFVLKNETARFTAGIYADVAGN